ASLTARALAGRAGDRTRGGVLRALSFAPLGKLRWQGLRASRRSRSLLKDSSHESRVDGHAPHWAGRAIRGERRPPLPPAEGRCSNLGEPDRPSRRAREGRRALRAAAEEDALLLGRGPRALPDLLRVLGAATQDAGALGARLRPDLQSLGSRARARARSAARHGVQLPER